MGYVNAHIHQGLNPKPHESTPRPSRQSILRPYYQKKKKKVYCVSHEIILEIKF
jgi:hypothetical protein